MIPILLAGPILAFGESLGLPPWALPVAIAGATVAMLILPRLVRKKNMAAGNTASPSTKATADRIQLSLEKLMVELFDMSRDINAQLETRISTLHELIRQADGRIRELQGLTGQKKTPDRPASVPLADLKPRAPGERPLLKTATSADPEHRKIYDLSDQGMTLSEISRATGRPLGEVQLILDLRRKEL